MTGKQLDGGRQRERAILSAARGRAPPGEARSYGPRLDAEVPGMPDVACWDGEALIAMRAPGPF